MIWVVAANAVSCRIYQYDKKQAKLSLLKEILHPENRLKKKEFLTSDKPGHYKASASVRGAYESRSDPKEIEYDNFAREIAKELDHSRKLEAFDKLIFFVTPHMHGLIFNHIDKHIKERVVNTIQKDPQSFNDKDLLNCVKTEAKFPDPA